MPWTKSLEAKKESLTVYRDPGFRKILINDWSRVDWESRLGEFCPFQPTTDRPRCRVLPVCNVITSGGGDDGIESGGEGYGCTSG